jgi:alpha-N-acetylglucosamine transferase
MQFTSSDYRGRRGNEEADHANANLLDEARERRILLALQCLLLVLVLMFFAYLFWVWNYIQSVRNPTSQVVPEPTPVTPILRELSWETPRKEKGFQRAVHEELGFVQGKGSDAGHHGKFAYAFYASSRDYLCGVLVNIARLKALGADETIDLLLLVPKGMLVPRFLDIAKSVGLRILQFDNPPNLQGGFDYYKHSNMKLLLFNQTEYDRIVYLDSDSLILKSLDHLFLLPKGIGIAAPRSYWEDDPKKFTSALMVIDPSQEMWQRVDKELHPIKEGKYDMDILNDVFMRDCMLLPNNYLVLNSHWEDETSETRLKNTGYSSLDSLASQTHVLHFTALGKPWSLNLSTVAFKRPLAHAFFQRSFQLWSETADKVC